MAAKSPIDVSYGSDGRPTPRQSEIDVGRDLGADARPQISFKGGEEVNRGAKDSTRPDYCLDSTCSVIEVKNYNISTNRYGLINDTVNQAIKRQEQLPAGTTQEVVIDVRGQNLTPGIRAKIIDGITTKSNGIISGDKIKFKVEQ